MGKKTTIGKLCLAGLAVMVNIVSVCLPFHKVEFTTFGALPAFRIDTYSLRIRVNFEDSAACFGVLSDKEYCKGMDSSKDLEDTSQRFCRPVVKSTFPNACVGLRNAYMGGMAVVFCVVANTIMNGVSAFLLYHYMTASPKKKYRQVAVVLQIGAVIFTTTSLLAYLPLVILYLDSIEPKVKLSHMLFGATRVGGTSRGYYGLWMGMLLQMVAIALGQLVKMSDEERYAEAREMQRFVVEMEMYQQAQAMANGAQQAQLGQLGHGYGAGAGYGFQGAGPSWQGAAPGSGGQGPGFGGPGGYAGQTARTNAPPPGWGAAWQTSPQMQQHMPAPGRYAGAAAPQMPQRPGPPYF